MHFKGVLKLKYFRTKYLRTFLRHSTWYRKVLNPPSESTRPGQSTQKLEFRKLSVSAMLLVSHAQAAARPVIIT